MGARVNFVYCWGSVVGLAILMIMTLAAGA